MTMEVGEKSQRDDDKPFSTTSSGLISNNYDDSVNRKGNDPEVGEDDPLDPREVRARVECSDSDKDPSPVTNGTTDSEVVDETVKIDTNIVNEPVVTPQQPLTFTINFSDDKEIDTAKYRNLFERYNARHRRNLSTSSKVETKTKQSSEAPVLPGLLSPNFIQRQKTPSVTHSEGYFSSDQEDDTRRKADQLSRKLKQLGLKSNTKVPAVPETMSRSYAEYENPTSPEEVLRPRRTRTEMKLELDRPTNGLYDSVKIQNGSRRDYKESRCRSESRYDRSGSTPVAKGFQQFDDLVEKLSSGSSESEHFINYQGTVNDTSRRSRIDVEPSDQTNLDALEVSNFDDGSDGAISEAGTYTIDKDYTDEEKARMDIDRVFSVGVVTEEETSEDYVHSFKMSISRENNWISEWATQVAEHNSLPSAIGGMNMISKGLISPQSPQSPSKIPSPIHSRSRRLSRGRQEQSDSSLETESYLRAKGTTAISPSMINDRVLVDSGGESDDDTSRSHNTPPQSLQRIGSARRSSLSDVLFARNSFAEGRRSMRNYTTAETRLRKDRVVAQEPLRSPTHVLARLQLGRRNSSLDRKEYASDTPESNCNSGRSSLKNYLQGNTIVGGSPVPNHVKTAKLTTNSPILSRKEIAVTRTSELAKSSSQAKNIGYFTCTENSPYMLRKSSSTASYAQHHLEDLNHRDRSREPGINSVHTLHQNSPVPRRSTSIQRSASNASVRNPQVANILLCRRGSFSNNTANDRTAMAGKFNAASDSSSEAGDKPIPKSPVPPVSSGIKLNRAFSIRRARLNCEYETTPTSTPEERRRKTQVPETRGSQASLSSRQSSTHHRGRSAGNSVQGGKESFKKVEQPKPRAPSISRTDTGRISTRAPKNVNHVQHSRPNQKPIKDAQKKPGRSNSTLTSKEVEFQNWKRRKNYDPMKAAAQGKKKLDTSKKQHSIEDSARGCESSVLRSASFHGTGGTLSLAADWSDNENEFTDSTEYIRPPPPSSPQLGSDSDFETSSYLRATENVVSAMSARMVVRHPPPVDSGGESDEDTSRSIHRPTHRGSLHPSRGSDTESSDEPLPVIQSPVANSNHVKIVPSILKKTRIEPREKKVSTPSTKPRISPRDARGNVDTTRVVARTDSGRFSMRTSKNSNTVGPSKVKIDNKKSAVPSSKEVEMQNWKRRKSYDPMKAAMEGRRKVGQTKRSPNTNLSPSHVLRSQSFHGSVGLGVSDWSDEELTVSADEASLY